MSSKKELKRKRREKRKAKKHAGRLAPKLQEALQEAAALIEEGECGEAEALLNELAEDFPKRVEPLELLLDLHHQEGDYVGCCLTARRLRTLRPDEPEFAACLAGAYLQVTALFHSLRVQQEIVERWPDSPLAPVAREVIARIEAEAPDLLRQAGLEGPDAHELILLHEELRLLTEAGAIREARELAEQLLQRKPDFIPALNNLGLINAQEGCLDEATALAERVLTLAPNNFHALANLVRFQVLRGRLAEAQATAERLKALTENRHDIWLKKAEALSFLGDDQGVIDCLAGAEKTPEWVPLAQDALLYHLAAVAELRQGHERLARKRWEKALQLHPGLDLARQNLEDLDLPVGERLGPWAFSMAHWLPALGQEQFTKDLLKIAKAKDDMASQKLADRLLEKQPSLPQLVPLLLDRGDPPARIFAVLLASLCGTPELLDCLKTFALGQRGADEERLDAAFRLCQLGRLTPGMHRLWREGEWRDTLLTAWEIHGEASGTLLPREEDLYRQALDALNRGDGKTAERWLRQGLELAPEDCALQNNLVKALSLQGRAAECDALARQIHERFPDYLFGRTNLAALCVREGDLARARELLEPLLQRQRLHFSEFAALAIAQIQLLLAERHPEAAQSWLEMWERVDPDHPQIPLMRQRIEPRGWLPRLLKWRG
jgi:Flp pilus assembly protein TadD